MPFLAQVRATPNLLTLLRLFIVPFIVIEILDGDYRIAFALFLFAGLTDALDGLLARWLRQKTTLGQYLDPIADKLLLSTLFLVLTHVDLIPRYVTVLVFSRDLGILLIATLLFATGALRDFRPSILGKLNTLIQIVGLVAVMTERVTVTSGWEAARWMTPLTGGLLRMIAVLAPLSAAQYAWIILRRIDTPAAV
ncbi:MAG: CDP-alcohol phosphatidyltransferase family protein [Edaphobacter sp.]|uniref:CDP-alcohol phosphatidyltransferase family protein n=1 Tax=Edaphobacter sp. TaxID=1934404 RepID=UPI002382FF8E|nr:CDP-alcohol phosphatidyltransferase family protein [Edaphobacter sp.]MDE1176397.1 CDP-alcohol phosphatidyltransferase family protein [Edaphobacter sp.]